MIVCQDNNRFIHHLTFNIYQFYRFNSRSLDKVKENRTGKMEEAAL